MPSFPGPFGGVSLGGPYSAQLIKLLPPGPLWNLERDSKLRALLLAMADEFERVGARGANLIEETDPRTASETIEQWEAMLSLPDAQVPDIPATLEKRRVAITQKYTSRGGQNELFWFALCEACGWPLDSLTTFVADILRVGFRVNDRVYGDAFAYALQFNVNAPTADALARADFERVIRHALHAHIVAIFVYL